MRRPEGFDHRPDRPADAPAGGGPPSSEDRSARPSPPDRPSPGDLTEPPGVDLDDVRADRPGSSAAPRPQEPRGPLSDVAGTTGKRLGQGFALVAEHLRGLSPDEDYVDPDARVLPSDRTDGADAIRSSPPSDAGARAAETAREARAARKRRRAAERAEIRRFTRRSRHRRAVWVTSGAVLVVLVLSVVVAVFSPLLALTRVEVHGNDRVERAQVRSAVQDQMGRPLARIDFGEIRRKLAEFPLIESYVTEEAPPHTLVVTITEREPIVAVQTSSGFDLVDPAGIVVEADPSRPAGMPLAKVAPSQIGGTAYRSMTEVVLSLPTSIRAQVSEVTATTADDVTVTLSSGAQVVWGSPDDSVAKARLLAALVRDHDARAPGTAVEYDVSAPDNGIIRNQG